MHIQGGCTLSHNHIFILFSSIKKYLSDCNQKVFFIITIYAYTFSSLPLTYTVPTMEM